MITEPLRFLVVDDNKDSRMLLVKTLLRKFPEAVVQECQGGDAAMRIVQTDPLSAIIAHRTFDYDGETLVALFRRLNPHVPIVMVSGYDRSARAIEAGANAFLNYDAWLQIGSVVAKVMAAAGKDPLSESNLVNESEPRPSPELA